MRPTHRDGWTSRHAQPFRSGRGEFNLAAVQLRFSVPVIDPLVVVGQAGLTQLQIVGPGDGGDAVAPTPGGVRVTRGCDRVLDRSAARGRSFAAPAIQARKRLFTFDLLSTWAPAPNLRATRTGATSNQSGACPLPDRQTMQQGSPQTTRNRESLKDPCKLRSVSPNFLGSLP